MAGADEFLKTPNVHNPATGEALKIFDSLNAEDSFGDREPASIVKRKVVAKVHRAVSNLPKDIQSGFEVRVHYKGISHTYWVMEKSGIYNFAYANSTGSRAAPPITGEDFSALFKSAEGVGPANKAVVAKCPKASVTIFVREAGKQDHVSAGCAEGKDKTSRQLQVLTNWLLSRM